MRRWIVGLLMIGSLAGCGGSSDSATAAGSGSGDAYTAVPRPDDEQRAALLASLKKIDPDLVVKEERAVDRSRNVCLDIIQGKPEQTLAHNAELRFEGGTVPELTAAQASQVVAAIRSSFCS